MNETQERMARRKAVRLKLLGLSAREIGRRLKRSCGWVAKSWKRFRHSGREGFKSQSKRPEHSPHRYAERVRKLVVRVRRALEKRKVGRLVGARAIEREIRRERLLPESERPSQSTIKRILHEAGLLRPQPVGLKVYFPQPRAKADYVLQLMDWTARYLEGGTKVYAFHSIDVATRNVAQTISANKSGQTTEGHALKSWQILGLPDGCQLDNDALWRGSLKTDRHLGRFMRLALYLGIELIFIPEAEPQRNGLVEWLNGLWAHTFWEQQRFQTLAHVQRCSPAFIAWYTQQYEPFSARAQTPAEARQSLRRRLLSVPEIRAIPAELSITAGRIHFIRLVDQAGDVRLLHETWHVDKRLAGRYVWATIITHQQQLVIWYRRSAAHKVRCIKVCSFALAETVVALRPEFKRRCRRRKLFTMS